MSIGYKMNVVVNVVVKRSPFKTNGNKALFATENA